MRRIAQGYGTVRRFLHAAVTPVRCTYIHYCTRNRSYTVNFNLPPKNGILLLQYTIEIIRRIPGIYTIVFIIENYGQDAEDI